MIGLDVSKRALAFSNFPSNLSCQEFTHLMPTTNSCDVYSISIYVVTLGLIRLYSVTKILVWSCVRVIGRMNGRGFFGTEECCAPLPAVKKSKTTSNNKIVSAVCTHAQRDK